MLIKLLVYGTLKNLNNRIDIVAKYLGSCKTKDTYVMFDYDGFYPLLIDNNYGYKKFTSHSEQVMCEMYEIDDTLLYKLDHIEGHPDFFRRKKVLNEFNEECFIYLFVYKDKKRDLLKEKNIIKSWNK